MKPGQGWTLAPAYDVNPDPDGDGLLLNITESDNAQSLDLAREVAAPFRIATSRAVEIVGEVTGAVRAWRTVAGATGIGREEQDRMARAFRLAERTGRR